MKGGGANTSAGGGWYCGNSLLRQAVCSGFPTHTHINRANTSTDLPTEKHCVKKDVNTQKDVAFCHYPQQDKNLPWTRTSSGKIDAMRKEQNKDGWKFWPKKI